MGAMYKRGRMWYIDVRVKGRRIRKRVGPSKKLAELALKDAEVNIVKGRFGFSRNDITIDKFFDLCLEYSQANNRPNTTQRYREVLNHFRGFLQQSANVTFLSEVNTELIDRFKVCRRTSRVNANGNPVTTEANITEQTRKGARAHTINFELDVLRMIFNLAIKWDYLDKNPTKHVTRLKIDDAKPPRFLTKEECQRLLEASPPNLYPIYFTFLSTGMRKSELVNLQWQNIDLERRKILIRHKKDWNPKSGERDIPMSDALHDLLHKMFKDHHNSLKTDYVFSVKNSGHSRNWMREQLIKIGINASIDDLTKLHTLRHTFASHLIMRGVDLPTVKRLMGHSDIETTMIYAHLAPDHLSDAVNKLPFS